MTVLVAVALTLAPVPAGPDQLAETSKAMDQVAVYVHDAERAAIEATMADAAATFGRWLHDITPPPAPPSRPAALPPRGGTAAQPPQTGTGGGDCYAGPIPSYIVNRESGGNPNAVNASSGAYGCFQIMPYVWSANCADLGRDVAGQIECANRISNGGTNLRPWSTG